MTDLERTRVCYLDYVQSVYDWFNIGQLFCTHCTSHVRVYNLCKSLPCTRPCARVLVFKVTKTIKKESTVKRKKVGRGGEWATVAWCLGGVCQLRGTFVGCCIMIGSETGNRRLTPLGVITLSPVAVVEDNIVAGSAVTTRWGNGAVAPVRAATTSHQGYPPVCSYCCDWPC